jgi:hypothetical protein
MAYLGVFMTYLEGGSGHGIYGSGHDILIR